MKFRGKDLTEITAFDINSLIENKVAESKTLDYKREIKFDERSKTELIYDISSFFNTQGGFIVVGLEEEKDNSRKNTGLPKLPDSTISISNYDEIQLRILETIKQTTNPQITNLSFSNLLTVQDTNVFIIGIRKSNNLPSMVIYGNQNRFYKRNSNGKYMLDTYELYETFTQIGILEERIAKFVTDRQEKVYSDNFLPGAGSINSILIHIVPLNNFESKIEGFSTYEIKKLFIDELYPPGVSGYSHRYCFEGFMLYRHAPVVPPNIFPYNLIFRNGCIETFTNEPFGNTQNWGLVIDGLRLIQIVRNQIQKTIRLYKKLSIDSPFYLSIKLNQIKGRLLTPSLLGGGRIENLIDMQFPITLLSDDVNEIKVKVKELFDVLWQTIDENECPSYMINDIFKDFKI